MTRREKRNLAIGIGGALVVGAIWGLLARKKGELPPEPGLQGLGSASSSSNVTRSSCLECVDKHLGAALVLLTETRDGYPHRLRAIGHLHEAEDESQAFPVLHEAIRQARKAYQQEDVVPDFDGLERMIATLRAA